MAVHTPILVMFLFMLVVGIANASPNFRRNEEESVNITAKSLDRNKRILVISDESWRGHHTWPKAIIPYLLYEDLSEYDKIELLAAHRYFEKNTCFRFVPYEKEKTKEQYGLLDESHAVFWKKVSDCSYGGGASPVGRNKNSAAWAWCCGKEACAHELGHLLGHMHEHEHPGRHNWITIDWKHCVDSDRKYAKTSSSTVGTIYSVGKESTPLMDMPYDITDRMHYSNKYVMHYNYRDMWRLIYESETDYYLFKSLAQLHDCAGLHCPTFLKDCSANDGYVSLVEGKCTCVCPTGLDPDTGCKTTIKTVSTTAPNTWPAGNYAVLSPAGGCAGEGFSTGTWKHYGDGVNRWSEDLHVKGDFRFEYFQYEFCVKDASADTASTLKWEPGTYCILRAGGSCPEGFEEGFVQFDDADDKTASGSGKLPDVTLSEGDTRMEFCCRHDGIENSPLLNVPNTQPLTLFMMYKNKMCQRISGMRSVEEYLWFDSLTTKASTGGIYPKVYGGTFKLGLCHYFPVNYNCGGEFTLDETNWQVKVTSPNYPAPYGTNMECTWLFMAPKGYEILLEFDEFLLAIDEEGKCLDEMEIRYNMPGQWGIRHCGVGPRRTIRSMNGNIIMYLRSDHKPDGEGYGFKATATLLRAMTETIPEKPKENRLQCQESTTTPPVYVYVPVCMNFVDESVSLITFSVKTCNGAYVKLSDTEEEEGKITRVILIGGWDNTWSVIRDKDWKQVASKKHSPNSCTEFKNFYISWKDGVIKVGTTEEAIDVSSLPEPFMTYTDPTPITVKSIWVSGYEHSGEWRFDIAKPPPPTTPVTDKVSETECTMAVSTAASSTKIQVCPGFVFQENTVLKFSVKTCSNADVLLSAGDSASDQNTREIFIGGWSNTWSEIRGGEGRTSDTKHSPLSCEEYRRFFVRWKDGLIQAGTIQDGPGSGEVLVPFVTYADAKMFPVKSVYIFGWDSPGDWKIVAEHATPKTSDPAAVIETTCEKNLITTRGSSNVRVCRQPETLPTGTVLKFTVRGCGYARVNLRPSVSASGSDSEGYYIRFGDASNTESRIYKGNAKMAYTVHSPLSCDEFRSFYVTWTKGVIETGTLEKIAGSSDKMTPFLTYADDVSDVGGVFVYSYPSPVEWKIDMSRPASVAEECYDRATRGMHYRGSKNFARTMEWCLNWTDVTHCMHNAFNPSDFHAGLEKNYCRNPDNTAMPWCYVTADCARDYCDVCNVEQTYDRSTALCRQEGACCGSRGDVVSNCARTCNVKFPPAPNKDKMCGPPKTLSDANLVGPVKTSYVQGDTVTYKCKTGNELLTVTCTTDGQWSEAGYVCGGCPTGWSYFEGACYKHYNERVNYFTARYKCQREGAIMATAKTEAEFEFVSFLRGDFMGFYLWLGLSDEKMSSEAQSWKWEDGTPLGTWTNWHSDHPKAGRHCVVIDGLQSDSVWYADKCSDLYRYMCKMPLSDRKLCADRLSDCADTLQAMPDMCQKHPAFASQQCPFTCGVCDTGSTPPCPVTTPSGASLVSPSGKETVSRGAVVSYQCPSGQVLSEGSLVKACGKDGKLVGKDPVCKNADAGCGSPPNVRLTTISYDSKKVGAEAVYSCAPSYEKVFAVSNTAVCEKDTNWSEPQIFCDDFPSYMLPESIAKPGNR